MDETSPNGFTPQQLREIDRRIKAAAGPGDLPTLKWVIGGLFLLVLGSTAFLFEKMEASRDELRGEINVVRDELRGEIGAARDQIQANASALVRIEAILEERLPRR